MSARQYGFTKDRSTVDAINRVLGWTVERTEKYVLGIFLDITGAFDCLWWPRLIKDMQANGCSDGLIELTKSYLDGRRAHISVGGELMSRTLTKGTPQGSQFGPDLWRQAVNPLLSEEMAVGTEIVAYADDLAILVAGKHRRELTERANNMLERARLWANDRKLSFSAAKTQILWLKGSLTPDKPLKLQIGELKVKMTPTAKYLGVTFDQKRTFSIHLAEKASDSVGLYSRLLSVAKSSWGLGHSVTKMVYNSVLIPRMSYAASTWAIECMRHYRHRNRAQMAQRRPLLAITRAYKTASTAALQVLAGVPPLDLELGRIARIERGKAAVRRGEIRATVAALKEKQYNIEALHLWERRWAASTKGRRTASWFPTVRARLERVWVTPDHYTSQFMTGHGDFAASLHRFGLAREASCKCGYQEDTSEHMLYNCPLFSREREILVAEAHMAGADWPCGDEFMTSSKAMFLAFKDFAQRALDAKMKDHPRA